MNKMSEEKVMNEFNPELEQAKNQIEYLECQVISAKEMLSETMNNCLILKSNVILLSKNTQKLHVEIANLKAEIFDLKNNQPSTDA